MAALPRLLSMLARSGSRSGRWLSSPRNWNVLSATAQNINSQFLSQLHTMQCIAEIFLSELSGLTLKRSFYTAKKTAQIKLPEKDFLLL